MIEQDRREFAQLWTGTWAMYGKEATSSVLTMAFEALRGYDLAEVRAGLSKHMQNPDSGQYAPKPADVIKHIGGGSDSRALVAWSKVDRALKGVGTYQSVAFDDPLIHAVLTDMGGWVKLGKVESEEWPFIGKEFERRYRGYLINPPASYPAQLTGIAEAQNNTQGYGGEVQVMLIGDRALAEQVLAQGQERPRLVSMTTKRINPVAALTHQVKQIGEGA